MAETTNKLICAWETLRNTEMCQRHTEAGEKLVSHLVESKQFKFMRNFIDSLLPNEHAMLLQSEDFVKSLMQLYHYEGKHTDVIRLIKNGTFQDTTGLLDLYDQSHYSLAELEKGRPLTSVQRFRVRKRHPPPPSICPEGRRPQSRLSQLSFHKLRSWINQHRAVPYPTPVQVAMLASTSGLSETQVTSWFSNARRRLRKDIHRSARQTDDSPGQPPAYQSSETSEWDSSSDGSYRGASCSSKSSVKAVNVSVKDGRITDDRVHSNHSYETPYSAKTCVRVSDILTVDRSRCDDENIHPDYLAENEDECKFLHNTNLVIDLTPDSQESKPSIVNDVGNKSGNSAVSDCNSAVSGGNSVVSGGNSVVSGGNSVVLGGNSVVSGGNSVVWGGNSAVSDGNSAASYGNSVVSDGNSAASDGNSAASYGNSVASYGNSAASYGNSAASYGNSAVSDGNSARQTTAMDTKTEGHCSFNSSTNRLSDEKKHTFVQNKDDQAQDEGTVNELQIPSLSQTKYMEGETGYYKSNALHVEVFKFSSKLCTTSFENRRHGNGELPHNKEDLDKTDTQPPALPDSLPFKTGNNFGSANRPTASQRKAKLQTKIKKPKLTIKPGKDNTAGHLDCSRTKLQTKSTAKPLCRSKKAAGGKGKSTHTCGGHKNPGQAKSYEKTMYSDLKGRSLPTHTLHYATPDPNNPWDPQLPSNSIKALLDICRSIGKQSDSAKRTHTVPNRFCCQTNGELVPEGCYPPNVSLLDLPRQSQEHRMPHTMCTLLCSTKDSGRFASYSNPLDPYRNSVSSHSNPQSFYLNTVYTHSNPTASYSSPVSAYSNLTVSRSNPVGHYCSPYSSQVISSSHPANSRSNSVGTYTNPVRSHSNPVCSYTYSDLHASPWKGYHCEPMATPSHPSLVPFQSHQTSSSRMPFSVFGTGTNSYSYPSWAPWCSFPLTDGRPINFGDTSNAVSTAVSGLQGYSSSKTYPLYEYNSIVDPSFRRTDGLQAFTLEGQKAHGAPDVEQTSAMLQGSSDSYGGQLAQNFGQTYPSVTASWTFPCDQDVGPRSSHTTVGLNDTTTSGFCSSSSNSNYQPHDGFNAFSESHSQK